MPILLSIYRFFLILILSQKGIAVSHKTIYFFLIVACTFSNNITQSAALLGLGNAPEKSDPPTKWRRLSVPLLLNRLPFQLNDANENASPEFFPDSADLLAAIKNLLPEPPPCFPDEMPSMPPQNNALTETLMLTRKQYCAQQSEIDQHSHKIIQSLAKDPHLDHATSDAERALEIALHTARQEENTQKFTIECSAMVKSFRSFSPASPSHLIHTTRSIARQ